MSKPTFKIYRDAGGFGVAFYLLGRDTGMVGVRDDSVHLLDKKAREVARLGPLAGSRAEMLAGGRFPVGVITFADGARYVGRELLAGVHGAAKEIAAYNKLAGYEPGPVGYVPSPAQQAQHAQQQMVWSCRFCATMNMDRPTCAHCGARRLTGDRG